MTKLLARLCLLTFTLLCTYVWVVGKRGVMASTGSSMGYDFEENEINWMIDKSKDRTDDD